MRNVALLTPELLGEVNRLVVEAGHELAGHDGAGQLQARCDSVVVETDVHYPTDVSLLWDALRCLIRVVAAVCQRSNVGGWRQARHLSLRARGLFNRVRSSRQRSRKGTGAQRVRRHLQFAGEIAGRAEGTLEELGGKGATEAEIQEIQWFLDLVNRLADQVKRRVLEGERIAQEEKIYSIYEPHTRWCSKGKAGKAVELGVPVSVVESEHQFVMHYKVMWSEQDVDVAPSMIEETQELHPGLTGCSFDKGYSSPGNRTRLDGMLDLNAMPKKGKLAKAGDSAGVRGGKAGARGGGVGDQQPGAAGVRPDTGARGGWVRAHGGTIGTGSEHTPDRDDTATERAGEAEGPAPAAGGIAFKGHSGASWE